MSLPENDIGLELFSFAEHADKPSVGADNVDVQPNRVRPLVRSYIEACVLRKR
jgi:hypothetical protein